MKNQFKQILQILDLYGVRVNLKTKREEQYSTGCGQFATLGALAIVLAVFVTLMRQMFALENPTVVLKQGSSLNPPSFNLNKDNFLIGIALTDINQQPLVNTAGKVYYEVSFDFFHYSQDIKQGSLRLNKKQIKVSSISCDQIYLPQVRLPESFKLYGQAATCIDSVDWDSKINQTYLQGQVASKKSSIFSLSVQKCNPLRRDGNFDYYTQDCAPDLEEKMNYGQFLLAYSDYLLDQSQPGDPYNPVPKIIYNEYSIGNQNQMIFTYRHSYLNDIINFFYLSPQDYSYHQLQLSKTQGSFVGGSDQELINLTITLDDRIDTHTRTYPNILDILGNIGGLWKLIQIIFSFVSLPYRSQTHHLQVINSIYQFEQPGHTKKPQQNNNIQQNRTLKKVLSKKNNKLQSSLWERLTFFLCSKMKRSMLQQAVQDFENQTCIASIINRLQEVEKLKQLLLDEDQIRMFDFISQPKIIPKVQINQKKVFPSETKGNIKKRDPEEKKLQVSLQSYKQVKAQDTQLNNKLIQMIDDQVKLTIENLLYVEQGSLQIQNTDKKPEIRIKLLSAPPDDEQNKISKETLIVQDQQIQKLGEIVSQRNEGQEKKFIS